MKILITTPFHDKYLSLLRDHCEVVYENWRETGTLFLDSEELIQKINDLSIDIFITEANKYRSSILLIGMQMR
jgi:soluble P-type ATPase